MVLLCCITDREKKAAHGMSIFCIDTTLPGFKKGKVLKKGFQMDINNVAISSNHGLATHIQPTKENWIESIRYCRIIFRRS